MDQILVYSKNDKKFSRERSQQAPLQLYYNERLFCVDILRDVTQVGTHDQNSSWVHKPNLRKFYYVLTQIPVTQSDHNTTHAITAGTCRIMNLCHQFCTVKSTYIFAKFGIRPHAIFVIWDCRRMLQYWRCFLNRKSRWFTSSYHISDVIMSKMASQITSFSFFYSTICPGSDQRKHTALLYWPLCGEFTGDRWIPHTKGQ